MFWWERGKISFVKDAVIIKLPYDEVSMDILYRKNLDVRIHSEVQTNYNICFSFFLLNFLDNFEEPQQLQGIK